MLGRNLGLAAASALGASAFLIPAGIAPADNEAPALAFSTVNPKNQVLRVPCSACLFPSSSKDETVEQVESEKDGLFRIQSASNDVILNFTISDEQTLELNGATIYPPKSTFAVPNIFIDQVPSSASNVEIENGEADRVPLEVTSLALGVFADMSPLSGDSVVTLKFNPLSIENKNIGFDEVVIELLKTVEGELLILNVERERSPFSGLPFFEPVVDEVEEVEEAEDMHCGPFCRLKGAIESKVDELKSFAHSKRPHKKPDCPSRGRPFPGGKLPSHIKPGFLHPEMQGEEDMAPFHGRPHHFGQHHGQHRGHHRHSFFHSFARGLFAVAIPILAGIAVGMSISIIGLVTGRLIALLWMKLHHGGRRGYTSVSLDDDECTAGQAEVCDEKVVYVAEEADLESPPVYENAPTYEEARK